MVIYDAAARRYDVCWWCTKPFWVEYAVPTKQWTLDTEPCSRGRQRRAKADAKRPAGEGPARVTFGGLIV
jgi:hypothetical protein